VRYTCSVYGGIIASRSVNLLSRVSARRRAEPPSELRKDLIIEETGILGHRGARNFVGCVC